MLAVAGGAVKWLFGLASGREASLNQREKDYRERIEAQVAGLEARLNRVERAYGVVVGVVHVWIDEIDHNSPSLPAIAAQLKLAFPVASDMPPELLNLVSRLDVKQKKAARG
jgi:hypothetical protein